MAATGQMYEKLNIGDFYENMSSNCRFGQNRAESPGTLHEDLSTYVKLP